MINVSNLGFSYGQFRVLNNISLKLDEGHIYGLLGENGVGKTTLLSLLCGLKKNQTGTIDIDGHNPYDREPSFLANIYYLTDDPSAINMSAIKYAENYGRFWNNFDMGKFNELLDVFEVNPDQKMDKMSCGQLKKTHISFALATNTQHLLMDEPTNGLDIPSKALVRKAITKYTSEDSCIVISTHQARDLENIIDPIIILDKQDVLLNASIESISEKLYFYYGNDLLDNPLYKEIIPGGNIQVIPNTTGEDSKVNIEALFNTVSAHKDYIKSIFSK